MAELLLVAIFIVFVVLSWKEPAEEEETVVEDRVCYFHDAVCACFADDVGDNVDDDVDAGLAKRPYNDPFKGMAVQLLENGNYSVRIFEKSVGRRGKRQEGDRRKAKAFRQARKMKKEVNQD